MTELQAA